MRGAAALFGLFPLIMPGLPTPAQEKHVLGDLDHSVFAVGFSRDSTMAVTGSGATITVWDLRTGKWQHRLKVQSGGITSVHFLPDNERVVAAGRDKHIRIWVIDTSTPELEIPIDVPMFGGVRSMALSPDGTMLAAITFENVLHLIDLKTKKVINVFRVHEREKVGLLMHSLAFSPDGTRLASAGAGENTTVVLDLQTKKPKVLYQVTGDRADTMYYVTWSRDGKILATAASRHVLFWDARNGDFLYKSDRFPGFVNGVAFSPTDDVLAIISTDTMQFWRTDIKQFTGGGNHKGVASLAFSPDGKLLITGSQDRFEKSAKIWQVPAK